MQELLSATVLFICDLETNVVLFPGPFYPQWESLFRRDWVCLFLTAPNEVMIPRPNININFTQLNVMEKHIQKKLRII